jgi:small subunit ribosomal protein S16
MGAKKKPFYRIVAADSRRARGGRYIESVGSYDPLKEPAEIKLDEERVIEWLNRGAQPTPTVRSLLKKHEALRSCLN